MRIIFAAVDRFHKQESAMAVGAADWLLSYFLLKDNSEASKIIAGIVSTGRGYKDKARTGSWGDADYLRLRRRVLHRRALGEEE